ncbi:peroxiredoxin [Sphingobium sp. SCG-1]|uniref:DsrE family protein n=1 Tax=Sphingobium sp. SCG-1 TaxID=2072936 RepID=UPI000CD6B52A|nr:DsrE family protein [Sphingobium sp. SCG-1]AUW59809.1 peroxiredoxin [Sphingobium sp. SCG-1]
MRRLKIVLLTADPERLRGALAAAAAHVALGGDADIFLQMDAAALVSSTPAPRDAAHTAAGMPTLTALMTEALALGVKLTACQSGLTLTAIDARSLDPRIAISGTVAFLQSVGDTDRLLFV